jgi:hypothetical protein
MKLFNELSATILDSLFEKFPVAIEFSIEEFPALKTIENSDVFFNTFKFLSNENYIKFQHQVYGGFIGVTLTSKGLSVLNAIPVSLKEPLSQSLKNALKKGSEEVLADTMKKIFLFGTNFLVGTIS